MLNNQILLNVELGKLNDFSDQISENYILADKAKYLSDSLFMMLSECNDNTEKLICFNQAVMLSDILFDYITQIYKKLSDLKTEYNELLDEKRESAINMGGNIENDSEN